MPDYGSMVADKAIRSIDRKLRISYGTAEKELRKKLKDFKEKFKEKDAAKKKQLAEGKISKQDYKNWLSGQVFIRGQWESKVKECQNVMLHHNEQAAKIVNERKLDVFAENYNYEAFLGEKQLGISFGIYNTQAVARMMQEEPQTLPEWKIDEEKDYEWNYKKVNNIVQQGIIQGEGIPEITDRLCKDLSTMNENKMRMFARTAITGAQNAGRQRQMEDAADMGIEVNKRWIATLDSRTRHWHRERDGEEVPYNEDFSGGLEYPGDPSGDPADVFNCRCTMVTIYPKYEDRSRNDVRRAYAEYEDEDGETYRRSYLTTDQNAYNEWKHEKEEKKEYSSFGGVKQPLVGQQQRPNNYVAPVFEDEQKYMELIGFERIQGEHSIEDDAKACNPFFTNDNVFETGANCQRCVNAYVARRRGYKARAQRRLFLDDRYARGVGYKSVYNTNEPERRLSTSIFEKDLTSQIVKKRFENLMTNGILPNGDKLDEPLPDGTIMILGGYWKDADAMGIAEGHLFIAEKRNGEIVYVDPQDPTRDASQYFDRMTPKGMSYFRADDKEFNKDIIEVIEKDDN